MPPFEFEASSIKKVQHAFDLTIMKMFADYLFQGDLTRVIYAPNAYCFRLRTSGSNMINQLNLPFMNLQCTNWSQDDALNWYSHGALYRGETVPGLGSDLFFKPIQFMYESNVWCRNQKDSEAVLRLLTPHSMKNHTTVEFDIDLYDRAIKPKKVGTLTNIGVLDFDSLEMGSDFAEKDWLEKNQITQVNTAFKVSTLWVKTNATMYPTEKILFSFSSQDTVQDDAKTIDDLYTLVVGHTLDQEVNGITDHSQDFLVEEGTPEVNP